MLMSGFALTFLFLVFSGLFVVPVSVVHVLSRIHDRLKFCRTSCWLQIFASRSRVNHFAVDHSQDWFDVLDLGFGDVHVVAVEYDEVGIFAGFQAAE
jgi:hypothetical protein